MADKNIRLFRTALEKCFEDDHERITCALDDYHVRIQACGGTEAGKPAETYVNELLNDGVGYERDVLEFFRAGEFSLLRPAYG